MVVSLTHMREELLPGLRLISATYRITPGGGALLYEPAQVVVFTAPKPISLPIAVGMGMAAVVIKNPVVSRRFWRT